MLTQTQAQTTIVETIQKDWNLENKSNFQPLKLFKPLTWLNT